VSGAAPSVLPLGATVIGARYAVLGLARTGLATVAALVAAGAQAVAWDDKPEARAQAEALGATIADLMAIDLQGFAGLLVSPGVPINVHPLAQRAREAHVPILGDIELFAAARPHLPPHRVVGITGTNGKSTTTALIAHLIEAGGVPARLGGNIGLPILGQQPLEADGVYVLELSSYQIDLTHSLACDVAVLTNITPDHMDRYDGDFLAYAASKQRLFTMQHADQVAVIATDDDRCRAIASHVSHRLMRVSAKDVDPAQQAGWPALQGPHNAQNVACAIAAVRALGIDEASIAAGLASFGGLAHRMERIAEFDGVLYVNDSKATNAEAAAPALAAYPPATDGRPRIHWIAGGVAKGEGIGPCEQWLGHIARAYLIGDAAPMLARVLSDRLPNEVSGNLEAAVAAARANARSGDVVLLSPAAASFDQFRDFEARGDAFRAMMAGLSTGGAGA
jgi:UDP-N-acetylmuramoylalanine--D-glutamate ligase